MSPYERRLQRYLETHPGASRQEARGHKVKKGSEYSLRVKRAKKRYPGIWNQAAAGRGGFLRFLNYIHEGDGVQMTGLVGNVEVDSRRRFNGIEKLVLPDDEKRRTKSFALGRLTRAQLRTLIALEVREGAQLTPVPSLDQRRLLSKTELGDLRYAQLPMQGEL